MLKAVWKFFLVLFLFLFFCQASQERNAQDVEITEKIESKTKQSAEIKHKIITMEITLKKKEEQ